MVKQRFKDEETRNDYLINLAYEQAAKQLEEGTASPTVLTHFLKQGTAQTQLQIEKVRKETALLEQKTIEIRENSSMKANQEEIMASIGKYSGKE